MWNCPSEIAFIALLRYNESTNRQGAYTMLKTYMQAAERGEPVWIGELREAFLRDVSASRTILRLTGIDGQIHDTELWIPRWENAQERAFVLEYITDSVFNLLSCFGGRELRFFLPDDREDLLSMIEELDSIFMLSGVRRNGYGKVISISNRLNRAFGAGDFHFVSDRLTDFEKTEREENAAAAELADRLKVLIADTDTKFCCGIDVGGTDIKAAVSRGGKLLFTKEHDWDPASYATAAEIIEPILLIARLLRVSPLCRDSKLFREAIRPGASLAQIRLAVCTLEKEHKTSLTCFNSIGLSFPDVVIHDRILGGETPKTGGLRRNAQVEYEAEFAKLDQIRGGLQALCIPNGRVHIANDGNIAAFTAAVEMAARGDPVADGVFAHSLGTDLGTGWINERGEIPPLTLEMYDFLLDLGSWPQRRFPPEDIRSVRNENSGLPDARKYLGQSAAFRLAAEKAPELLQGFLQNEGGLLQVQKQPEDMRKACLEHLMRCAEEGEEEAVEVFRQIGRNLGQISREIRFLLHPRTNERFLYGRFVKHPACFSILRDGFREIVPALELIPADDELACSPLMRQLADAKDVTVAQFGQAVGAIYYGLSEDEPMR